VRTLDAAGLKEEDLRRLCTLEQLNWSVLNESVGRCLIGLRSELLRARQQKRELENQAEQQEREIEDLRNERVREQSEKGDLEIAFDEQRRRNGHLEAERNRQEEIIAKQASEIEVFKNATNKYEKELTRRTEANEAQRGELGQQRKYPSEPRL
jgi:septal ring factor EnvC (AmiA/AmiB activator)